MSGYISCSLSLSLSHTKEIYIVSKSQYKCTIIKICTFSWNYYFVKKAHTKKKNRVNSRGEASAQCVGVSATDSVCVYRGFIRL